MSALPACARRWCAHALVFTPRPRSEQPPRARWSKEAAGVQAYVVPSEDPHQSEYAAACYERRQFISRFTARAS